MPSRIIREGWLESERINQLDPSGERFFLRTCLRADDFGRYHANPILLKSALFPLSENVRSTDIPRWLAACETAGLLRCYEVDGKRYLQIHRFDQRTRAQSSKFPAPPAVDGHLPDTCPAPDRPPRTDTESDSEAKVGVGVGVEGAPGSARSAGALIIPMLLNTAEFLTPWAQWQAIRQKGKKPKTSWEDYFAGQLAWLERFGLEVAIEIVANSARNQWQGLFELKGGANGRGGNGRKAGFA